MDKLAAHYNLISHAVPAGTDVTHERSSWDFTDAVYPSQWLRTPHETAICRNPPIHGVAGDRKPWSILSRPTLKHVIFYEHIRTRNFLWAQHFVRRYVCNEVVYSSAGFSLDELCGGWLNDKLPLHWRYSTEVASRWQCMQDIGSNVSIYSRQRSLEGHFAPHRHSLLLMREIVTRVNQKGWNKRNQWSVILLAQAQQSLKARTFYIIKLLNKNRVL